MSGWQGRTTGQGSTRQWRKTRTEVLERDRHTCQLQWAGCTRHANIVDHITNIAAQGITRRDAVNPRDLHAVCAHCHDIKTQQEARATRPPHTNHRPRERHPGLIQ